MSFNLAKNRIINIVGTGIISGFVPGLGHISCGKIKQGIIIYFLSIVAPLIAIYIATQPFPPFNVLLGALVFISVYLYAIVHSILLAKNPQNSLNVKPIIGYCILVGGFLLNFKIIAPYVSTEFKAKLYRPYKIPSNGMSPTLISGDYIIVDKYIYKKASPERGDIIVFAYPKDPSKDFVKRLIGLSGEKIEIKDKQLYINDQKIPENYIALIESNQDPAEEEPRDNYGPVTVPQDSLFVLGDNRENSYDSRYWGFVPKNAVKGRAKSIYFSRNRETGKIRWERIGRPIERHGGRR